MTEPVIVPRVEHPISRRDIDPDALKVLYRLRQFKHIAYLVGGSVRDLLLGRKPKDFDIGTSAHPYEVKRLFRNCWIIGRRFRLAHVKFGNKTIEVATFRRQVLPAEAAPPLTADAQTTRPGPAEHHDPLIHRDNTFGTPEEDAFRRDFTLNALFYDVETLSIIDYVGGLKDIELRLVRCIGNPEERFREDPVRMLRAVALAARLAFDIDPPILEAIRGRRAEITRSAPPRVLEEYYKILRAGAAERTFRWLAELGLLDQITPELQRGASDRLWRSLAALDRYRQRFNTAPEILSNPIVLGMLLAPLGLVSVGRPQRTDEGASTRPLPATLGMLSLPRRDIERLRQILAFERRLTDPNTSARVKRALMHRNIFAETLTWLEIQGNTSDVVQQWRAFVDQGGASHPEEEPGRPRRFRRRRRRRRRFPGAIQ